ncbi:MAG: hypothetical protein LBC67_05740 [Spirochaetales bacterium]|jgi:hypothetical protein|nr:hypothetical protein [Spirochaetales bacterium]
MCTIKTRLSGRPVYQKQLKLFSDNFSRTAIKSILLVVAALMLLVGCLPTMGSLLKYPRRKLKTV